MRKIFTLPFLLLSFCVACNTSVLAQNSVLINFGDTACGGTAPPSFSFIRDPLSAAPVVLTNCDLQNQLPDIYYVFIAYNPLNGKIYIADTRTGTTRIWMLDMGLPADIACPPLIPLTPDYSYTYTSNNFEFDNNGDLWSLSNFDPVSGQAHIDKFDVTTGNILGTSILQFPSAHYPSFIYSGDITILPNGRMFAVLGIPSQLYEITGYTTGNATATYLQTAPKSCFGMAYLNGGLELTGFDGVSCYRYAYSIGSNILSAEQPFQNGQTPVDNSSISPTIGTAKRLLSAQLVNSNTANISYEIYVENIGNVKLNDISLTDDLGAAFGAGNVSNVTANALDANIIGLTLNPSYDGVNDINILNPGTQLPNKTTSTTNYFFNVIVTCTVTNLHPSTVYLNSAISGGSIGNSLSNTRAEVADSSNNGDASATDPNNDGNPSEPGENVPTPFDLGALPVHFLDVNAVLTDKTSSLVTWLVATPMQDAAVFEPEYSSDGIHWTRLSTIPITDPDLGNYSCAQKNIPPGFVFYRVKQIDKDGAYIYSKVVSLRAGSGGSYAVFPNPADEFISIIAPPNVLSLHARAELFDVTGRLISSNGISSSYQQLSCAKLPAGTYFLKIKDDNSVFTQKLVVRH